MIVAPAGSPYQRWADEAKVPTPSVTLTVIEEPCPTYLAGGSEALACTMRGTNTIWMSPEAWSPKETFFHELGHNFDYYDLTEWERNRFRGLVHDYRPWEANPEGPNEGFAAAYALCAMGTHSHGDPRLFITEHRTDIRQATLRAICRMIDRG